VINDKPFIQKMKVEVADKQRAVQRTYNRLRFFYEKKQKAEKTGLNAAFYQSLIEYYGATEGKQRWAAYIRSTYQKQQRLRRDYNVAKQKACHAKEMLRLATRK
jgi:hypothetical protein